MKSGLGGMKRYLSLLFHDVWEKEELMNSTVSTGINLKEETWCEVGAS